MFNTFKPFVQFALAMISLVTIFYFFLNHVTLHLKAVFIRLREISVVFLSSEMFKLV